VNGKTKYKQGVCACGCSPEEKTIYLKGYTYSCYWRVTNANSKLRRDKKGAGQPGKKKKAGKINQFSDKRLKELAIYRKVKGPYLEEHPVCEVDDCNKPSTHIHHKKGRDGKLVHDIKYFMAVCNICHPRRIHETQVEWAKEKGYLLLR
jgi:hypothetical protein